MCLCIYIYIYIYIHTRLYILRDISVQLSPWHQDGANPAFGAALGRLILGEEAPQEFMVCWKMAIYTEFMGFYSDLMGFHDDSGS